MRRLILALLFTLVWISTAHATTKYVNSVQHETVTIASGSTSGTTSVTAATGTFILLYNGCYTSAAADNSEAFAGVTISGTTLTATRGLGTAGAVTCSVDLIDATSNLVTSVQFGSKSLTTSSGTSTITTVTTTNSAVFYQGMSQTLASFHFDLNTPTVALTNATTVTTTLINGASGTTVVYWEVVQFAAGALNSSTQQKAGTWTNSTGTTNITITGVTAANSMIAFEGGGSSNGDTAADEMPTYSMTSGTVVKVTVGNTSSGNSQTYQFTVIEFASGVLLQSVQRSTIALSSATTKTATITS